MRAQRLMLWCGVAVGMAAIALASPMAAQGPGLRGSIPRTADGHPDLQGTYDIATITPLDRPAQFGSVGGPEVDPNPRRQRSASGLDSGLSYALAGPAALSEASGLTAPRKYAALRRAASGFIRGT